jgi:hypothetical protein
MKSQMEASSCFLSRLEQQSVSDQKLEASAVSVAAVPAYAGQKRSRQA